MKVIAHNIEFTVIVDDEGKLHACGDPEKFHQIADYDGERKCIVQCVSYTGPMGSRIEKRTYARVNDLPGITEPCEALPDVLGSNWERTIVPVEVVEEGEPVYYMDYYRRGPLPRLSRGEEPKEDTIEGNNDEEQAGANESYEAGDSSTALRSALNDNVNRKTREELLQEMLEHAARLSENDERRNTRSAGTDACQSKNDEIPELKSDGTRQLTLWGLSLLVIVGCSILGHWCALPFHHCGLVAELVGMSVTVVTSTAGVTGVWAFIGGVNLPTQIN